MIYTTYNGRQPKAVTAGPSGGQATAAAVSLDEADIMATIGPQGTNSACNHIIIANIYDMYTHMTPFIIKQCFMGSISILAFCSGLGLYKDSKGH